MSPGEVASRRREFLIDRLMIWLQRILGQRVLEWTRSRADSSSEHKSDLTSSNDLSQLTGPSLRRGSKRQRQNADEKERGNGNETTLQKRRKGGAETPVFFACPFLKHNEGRYRHPKWTCCWHGWPTVHRVKEHLYRRHVLPRYQCSRCGQDLASLAGLTEHQRLLIPCQLEYLEPREGIDEDQERRLRARQKKDSEDNKWFEVYRILFPHDELVPSPYQAFFVSEHTPSFSQDSTTVLERFEVFSQSEFPRRMRPHIEDLVDRAVEQTLTPDILSRAFASVLQSMFNTFRERNGTAEANAYDIATPVQPVASGNVNESRLTSLLDVEGQANLSTPDMHLLADMVGHSPSQQLEFDFDTFSELLQEDQA
ncbi:hypothetical protein EDB81DRAFT_950762 [Dactylonectria macrodidyma]|uniref:C2H2-type domain-containing protein n=1 Tax=Dactylonectria macrodidyma TaxID=307937 RepID=A0A9P9E1G7_9HYPO|nr:hypothetical protein EDB81DRAFT_950762 [Dactylonectria macrodidyma]